MLFRARIIVSLINIDASMPRKINRKKKAADSYLVPVIEFKNTRMNTTHKLKYVLKKTDMILRFPNHIPRE